MSRPILWAKTTGNMSCRQMSRPVLWARTTGNMSCREMSRPVLWAKTIGNRSCREMSRPVLWAKTIGNRPSRHMSRPGTHSQGNRTRNVWREHLPTQPTKPGTAPSIQGQDGSESQKGRDNATKSCDGSLTLSVLHMCCPEDAAKRQQPQASTAAGLGGLKETVSFSSSQF